VSLTFPDFFIFHHPSHGHGLNGNSIPVLTELSQNQEDQQQANTPSDSHSKQTALNARYANRWREHYLSIHEHLTLLSCEFSTKGHIIWNVFAHLHGFFVRPRLATLTALPIIGCAQRLSRQDKSTCRLSVVRSCMAKSERGRPPAIWRR
jgi:hypothetical protein